MRRRVTILAALSLAATAMWGAAEPGITFIGRGEIPGSVADKSGLTGSTCQLGNASNCIPNTTFGGLGSAITYTGYDNVFLAVPDRGPFDGRTNVPYLNRFHFLQMTVDTSKNPNSGALNINWKLLATRFLQSESYSTLLGDSSAVEGPRRFDPEGVAISPFGTFFISDEYGPYIYEFSRQGRLIHRIPVPLKFLIAHSTGDVNDNGDSRELYKYPFTAPDGKAYGNNSGRQANRGMEGLAITPNGRYLVGIMQNALIQDNALTYANPQTLAAPPARVGLNNRIFKYDLYSGQSWEYVYVMDSISQGKGVNEILAINDHEFLVVERDNRSLVSPGAAEFSPASSGQKRIYKIDLDTPGLTDVSAHDSLPATFTPVKKVLFIDMLNPAYEVDVNTTPHATIKSVVAEKIEGLAWGPNLRNGHLVLYVLSDNDLNTSFPTQIYAFEVDPFASGLNINFVRQLTGDPLFPLE